MYNINNLIADAARSKKRAAPAGLPLPLLLWT